MRILWQKKLDLGNENRYALCHSVSIEVILRVDAMDKLLTINELTDYLNVSRRTVYRLLDDTEFPAYRVGGHLRFRREEVDEWLQKQRLTRKETG